MNEDKRVVWCDCGDMSHHLMFECFEWDDGDTELMVYYRMVNYLPFMQRVILGIKYIFGIKPDRVDYMDIVISDKEKLIELRDTINMIIEKKG